MTYLILIAAYLIGSLPFGYIIARIFIKTDIRSHGSGNIGATNVLRVAGWKAALPVFVLDLLKGSAAVIMAKSLSGQPEVYLVAGLLSMVGHSFPIFLRFKGGKAAATGIGVLIALSWQITVILAAVAAIIIGVTRYVSLASIIGSCLVPILFWLFGFDIYYIVFGLVTALLVCIRHKQNIERLIKGTESKLGNKS